MRDRLLRFARNDGSALAAMLLRRLRRLPEHPRRRRKPARRAVGHLDLILPRQTERAGHHVLHESIRAIHRAAFHRDVTAVPELIDVVLDTPVDARLADQIRAHFGGDDLVRAPRGAVAMMLPSKFTIMPSPIESNEPSEPHMQTFAVTIKFWNELA